MEMSDSSAANSSSMVSFKLLEHTALAAILVQAPAPAPAQVQLKAYR